MNNTLFKVIMIFLFIILTFSCNPTQKDNLILGKWENTTSGWIWEFYEGDSVKIETNIKGEKVTLPYTIKNDTILILEYKDKVIKKIVYISKDTIITVNRGFFSGKGAYVRVK